MKTIHRISWLAGLLVSARLAAQQPGSLDTAYQTVAGTDAQPTVLAPMADGRLYVGGTFTSYGGTGRAAIARLKTDGTVDTGFTAPLLRKITPPVILNGQVLLAGSTNAGTVTAALVLPDGRPVIAGSFSHVGATPAPGLAVLNLDGTAAATGFAVSKIEPAALLAGPGGTFYVGGKGTVDTTRLPLLRFRPDGSTDAAFTPPTLAALGYAAANPYILRPGPGDSFYIVTAAAVGVTPTSDIVRLTSSGAVDASFAVGGKGGIPFSTFGTFVTDPAGRLTFTGVTSYRGTTLNQKINRLTVGGDLDATYAVTVDPGFGGRVIAVQADGKLLYTSATVPINRLNADGTVDTAYANPAKVPVAQTALSLPYFAFAPDGSLFGGGFTLTPAFAVLNGAFHIFGDPNSGPAIAVEPLAQTNTLGARTRFFVIAQGAAPLSYQWFRGNSPIGGATGTDLVLTTTAAGDEADYHCVVSNSLGSTPSATVHLTLLAAAAGSVYRETDVPAGPNREVAELTLAADGSLFAVGKFTTWDNTNRAGVVRLLPNSVDVDPVFNPNPQTGYANTPYAEVLPLAGGKAFVAGGFGYTVGAQRFSALRFNADGALDPTFLAQNGDSVLEFGFLSGRPAIGPDGKVVLWASYWNGENTQGSIIRIRPDGTRDTTFALHPAGFAVTALPDGRYLVAGRDNAQPGYAAGVVRRNADGTPDLTFDSRSPLSNYFNATGDVNDILVQPDGRILVAGTFTYRANTPSPEITVGLVRLLPDGRPDPAFNAVPALGQSADFKAGGLRRIALQADGRIVGVGSPLGGTFPRSGLVRFWPNGALDPEFQVATNSVKNVNDALSSVAVRPDNAILVGGSFSEFSGFPRTNFVRINGGPLRPTPAPPTIASQPTRVVARAGTSVTLTVEPDGDGPFQFQWRRNYTIGDTNMVDIPGANGASYTLASPRLQPQDTGLFQCAVVNPGGAAFTTFIRLLVEPDPVVPGQPDTSLVAPGFQGILTGQYQLTEANPDGSLYGSLGNTIVRLLEDGTRDVTFNPPTDLVPAGGGIAVVKRQPDGKILIAGRLKDGALARLLPDGSYDPGFVRTNSYTGGFQDVPWEMGLQSDGRILLGGAFDNFAGKPVTGLLRFLPDGRVDSSFPLTGIDNIVSNPTRTLPGRVVALRVLSDDRIYIGGGFSHVRGEVRYGVARLNADGSLDSTFVPPTNGSTAGGTSGSMLFYQLGPVSPEGGIYIFGQFRPDLSQPGDTILRLLPSGLADPTFHVLTDFQVNTGVVQGDGKLIITGQFGQLNGQARGGFARLNLDGSTDATFTQGATFGVGVALSILPDGKLLAGNRRFFTGAGPAVAAPAVSFTLKPDGLQLTWPAGYQLQRATQLAPPNWQNLANPSPFTAPTSGPGEFYRVVPAP